MSENTQIRRSNSSNTESEESSLVDEELELLRSIYVHELEVAHSESGKIIISLELHPATADKTEEQFVRLTLVLTLPTQYPQEIPEVVIRNSRGLADDDLKRIHDDLRKKADQNRGTQVLYELIELAKEHLTSSNTPSGQCAICLYGFDPKDVFTKTNCYHHFHAQCLARYVEAMTSETDGTKDEIKMLCPVCREEIQCDTSSLKSAPPPLECEMAADFIATPELKERQVQMANLLQRQQERGGIIDVEAEKNKYFLEISLETPTTAVATEMAANNSSSLNINNDGHKDHPLGKHFVNKRQKPKAFTTKEENAVATEEDILQRASSIEPTQPFQSIDTQDSLTVMHRETTKSRGRGGRGRSNQPSRPRCNDFYDSSMKSSKQESFQEEQSKPAFHHRDQQPRRLPLRGRNTGGKWQDNGRDFDGDGGGGGGRRREDWNTGVKRERTTRNGSKNTIRSFSKTMPNPNSDSPSPTGSKSTLVQSPPSLDRPSESYEGYMQSRVSWGYGPPPTRFSKDPMSPMSPSGLNQGRQRVDSPLMPPPGFQARPPFPRNKPPPGFLAS